MQKHSKVTGFHERFNVKTGKFTNWKHDHNDPRNKTKLEQNDIEAKHRAYQESYLFD